jgi:hypothetical protein
MAQLDPADLVTSVLQLRAAIVGTRDRSTRSALRDVEVRLREALGPTITKTKSAAVLGISVTALDRWVDQGVIPVVARPGSTRHELEARPLLELAEQVRRVREETPATRVPVALAVRRLGWRPSPAGKRVLRFDVAALPRPNISEQELVAGFRSTTQEQRVREAAELSQIFARPRGTSELVL